MGDLLNDLEIFKGNFKLLTEAERILHHYVTTETLWKILDSDFMRAGHVRFSNDSEEYELGKRLVLDFLKSKKHKIDNLQKYKKDCFMICFCADNNLLSQWREYANYGVSIGFEFNDADFFTIMNNKATLEKIPEANEERTYAYKGEYCVVPNKPFKVQYISEETASRTIHRMYKKHLDTDLSDRKKTSKFLNIIPYLKNAGFRVEEERRLIFELGEGMSQQKVDYLDVDGYKKPYICVRFGNGRNEFKECGNIKLNCIGAIENELKTLTGLEFEVGSRDRNTVVIEPGKKQEEIFDKVVEVLKVMKGNLEYEKLENSSPDPRLDEVLEKLKGIKVWCEGHLPIRKITVGPNPNQYEVAESIEHYIQNKYWLRYVDIEKSKIPYRNKK